MKCLLLALGVALVCGTQATSIPQTMEDLDLQKANQACVERNIVAQKTEDPAVFTVDYQGERTVSVLDTDYTHYVFFCLGAPLPSAEHSTMCQYLARTLKVDEEVVEKFNRALKSLPEHIQIIPDQTQGQERCRV